jgi:hypothetical protein
MFIAAESIGDSEQRIKLIKNILTDIPNKNYEILQNLCLFLLDISKAKGTLITTKSLGIIFAPNVIKPKNVRNINKIAT